MSTGAFMNRAIACGMAIAVLGCGSACAKLSRQDPSPTRNTAPEPAASRAAPPHEAASVLPAAAPAELFSPGVISGPGSNYAPAFTLDSSTVYFSRKLGNKISIMVSRQTSDGWSAPETAPFSGTWVDLESAMSPDGRYMIFVSDRPSEPGGAPLITRYEGNDQIGGALWRTDLSHGAWTAPRRLNDSVNASHSTWTPSIARNGDLYFMSTDIKTGHFRLHIAPASDRAYGQPSELAFSNGEVNDVDPMIDPDQRFLIFSSDRAAPGPGDKAGPERLFIAFDPQGKAPLVCPLTISGWEDPSISQVEARVSRDGQTLYFSSVRPKALTRSAGAWDDGKGKIWMLPFLSDLWRAGAVGPCADRDMPAR